MIAGMTDPADNTTRDTTDRATRHDIVSVNEAAVALGITPDSVRARLRRGSLDGEKIGPVWYVFLDGVIVDNVHNYTEIKNNNVNLDPPHRATRHDTPRDTTRHHDTTSRDTDRDELVDELRRDKIFLQEQLDRALRQLEAERQRADVLQALGTGTTPDTSSEAPQSPQTSEPAPTGLVAWWKRLWGG